MKKEKKEFQSIITINPYSESYYRYQNNKLTPVSKLKFHKNTYFASFIANKDLIIAPVSISRNIEDEDIAGVLEDKAYEELGLDPAVEYMIQYKEFESEEEGRNFQLFIIEEDRYIELFANLRSTLRYVDLITPAPLLYKTLYEQEILESNNKVHCFFYFTKYDTTLTFYKNGEYLYSKSINYSLEQIYDRYCEIAGKTVDEKQFFRIFQKEGIKTTLLEYQENLMKLFNEIFITINDVVIYTKRAYKIEHIDQMFIGSELGPISGADEYAQNYLGLYSSNMIFNFDIDIEDWYIDQLHFLLLGTAQEYIENDESTVNFSIYPRPPAFPKRPSGQFIISLIVAILIASAYPLYFLTASYLLNLKNYQLSKQEASLSKEVNKYKNILAKKNKEIAKLDKEIDRLKNIYIAKEKTLISVYNKKVNYRLKSNQFASFAKDLDEFNIHTDSMGNRDDEYTIDLISKSDRDITKLIRLITKKYASEISQIDIASINENNGSVYTGVLKVKMR